jgi:hypothetical protein
VILLDWSVVSSSHRSQKLQRAFVLGRFLTGCEVAIALRDLTVAVYEIQLSFLNRWFKVK